MNTTQPTPHVSPTIPGLERFRGSGLLPRVLPWSTPIPLKRAWLGLIVLGLGLLPAAVFAQQQAGGAGRALDANQRSGSGGVNQVEGQVDYQARNNVITGNAPGGRSFRGNVGYTAPGEFRGRLGSDSLYRFRRDSLGSSPLLQGNLSNNRLNGGATNAPASIYRNFSGARLSTDQDSLGNQSRLNTNANVNTLNSPDQLGGTGTLGDLIHGQGGNQHNQASGANHGLDGGRALEASPLLGVRRYNQPNNQAGQNPNQNEEDQETGTDENQTDQTPNGVGQNNGGPGDRDQASRRRLSSQLHNTRLGFNERGASNVANQRTNALRGQGPPVGVVLGRQLQELNRPGQGPQGRLQQQRLSQRLSRLNDTLSGQRGANATARSGKVYQDLLQSMNRRSRQDTFGAKPDGQNQQGAKGTDQWTSSNHQSKSKRAQAGANDQGPFGQASAQPNEKPGFSMGLQEPDQEQVTKAEQRASTALEQGPNQSMPGQQANGPNQSNPNGSNQPPGTQVGDQDARRSGELTGSMNSDLPESARKLLSKLGTDLPRVETLTEDSDSRSSRLMKTAGQKLAHGHFFDAEALYRQARNNNPNNPMSRVGLVHAQMAAGLVRSATFNLRQLFENHPELMNVRYERKLLPPKNRLKWLQSKLNDMIEAGQGGSGPGLMLAYLGHQVRSRQLVRYGLAQAQTAAPNDPLLATARNIWLGSGTAATAQPPQK